MRFHPSECCRPVWVFAVCLACLWSTPLARAASGAIDPNRPDPGLQGGMTGAGFEIDKGYVLKVKRVEPGTPADGRVL